MHDAHICKVPHLLSKVIALRVYVEFVCRIFFFLGVITNFSHSSSRCGEIQR